MPDALSVIDRARPFSTLCLTIHHGSLDDPPELAGRAWLTAQMLLRGSEGKTRQQIADALDGLGSVVELSVGRDHTMLWADALTRKRPELIAHLAHILAHPTFDALELDRLKRETLAEIVALRDDDGALGLRFFVRALYGAHAYGRPLKGNEASLERIGPEDLRACYRTWTRADALLGLAGDVDPTSSLTLAEQLTQALGVGVSQRPTVVPPALPPAGGHWRAVVVDKPERSQIQVFLGHVALVEHDSGKRGVHHPDWTALQVGQTTFGGTFTSRFSHEIREKRGWSYGAWSQLSGDQRLGTFILRYTPAAKDLRASLEVTDELFQRFVADGPSDAELDMAQSYLQNGFVFAIDTAQRRLSELLSARLLGHPDGWVDQTVERLKNVAHADAVAAVRKHLRPDALVLTVVGDASQIVPALSGWPRIGELEVVDWQTPL